MKKHKIASALIDIYYIFQLRMKLVLKDKVTLMLLVLSMLFSAWMVRSLSVAAQDLSSLPVGIVDLDQTSTSRALIQKLEGLETIRLVKEEEEEEEEEEKLQKLLFDERITSIFVIEEGYEEAISSGDIKDIITMHYKRDNGSASILSDVVAGEMIYSICYHKTLRYYRQLPFEGTMLTDQQYENHMKELVKNSRNFDFAFTINYVNTEQAPITQSLSNTVLYNQLIFGILGLLVAFIALFFISGTVRDKDGGVDKRLRISKFTNLKLDIGNIGALLIIENIYTLILSALVYGQLKLQEPILWLSIYGLLMLDALVIGTLLLLIAKYVKHMHIYQVLCTALLLLTGGLGFYLLLTGFYQDIAGNMLKIIPNSWLIVGFTDIIINGSEGGALKVGHRVLLLMLCLLVFLLLVIDISGGFHAKYIRTRNRNRTV